MPDSRMDIDSAGRCSIFNMILNSKITSFPRRVELRSRLGHKPPTKRFGLAGPNTPVASY